MDPNPAVGLRSRRLIAFAAVVTILAVISVAFDSRSSPGTTVQAQSATRIIHTQDVYLYASFRVADADGNMVDVSDAVLAKAEATLDSPVSLGGGISLRRSSSLTGRALDQNGKSYPSITVDIAVVSRDDGSTPDGLMAISSADLAQQNVNLGEGDQIGIDLSGIPGVSPGVLAEADYGFIQALMPADMSTEAGLSNLEIFARRFQQQSLQALVTFDGNGIAAGMVTGAPLTLVPAAIQSLAYASVAQPAPPPTESHQKAKDDVVQGKVTSATHASEQTGATIGAPIGVFVGVIIGLVAAAPTLELGAPLTVPVCGAAGGAVGAVVGAILFGWQGKDAATCQARGEAYLANSPVTTPLPRVPPKIPTPAPIPALGLSLVDHIKALFSAACSCTTYSLVGQNGNPVATLDAILTDEKITVTWTLKPGEASCHTFTPSFLAEIATWYHAAANGCSHTTTDHPGTISVVLRDANGFVTLCTYLGSTSGDGIRCTSI